MWVVDLVDVGGGCFHFSLSASCQSAYLNIFRNNKKCVILITLVISMNLITVLWIVERMLCTLSCNKHFPPKNYKYN